MARRQTTAQRNIARAVNAQRYNGGGRWGSGGGGYYIAERDANGRATNSGNRNNRLGTREQKRADIRAAFAKEIRAAGGTTG